MITRRAYAESLSFNGTPVRERSGGMLTTWS